MKLVRVDVIVFQSQFISFFFEFFRYFFVRHNDVLELKGDIELQFSNAQFMDKNDNIFKHKIEL